MHMHMCRMQKETKLKAFSACYFVVFQDSAFIERSEINSNYHSQIEYNKKILQFELV